jgi:hypothetical protein
MHHFRGWREDAIPENLEFDAKHVRDLDRLAFIFDQASEEGIAAFSKPFAAADVRYFDESQAGKARQWIYDDLPAF